MKQYLAIFCGSSEALENYRKLPEAEQKASQQRGMEAWMQWALAHKGDIVNTGSPLGKTKKISKKGIEDIRNELGAWCVVQAESHEEAAKMFVDHPHFTIFPGDRVEVMECLPIPRA